MSLLKASEWVSRKVEARSAELIDEGYGANCEITARTQLDERFLNSREMTYFVAGMRRAVEYLEEYERTVKPYER